MYKLNGVELSLDNELLEKYSELALAEVGSTDFNKSLEWLCKVMLKVPFDKAVDLYGPEIVARKITVAMEEELDTFTMEQI